MYLTSPIKAYIEYEELNLIFPIPDISYTYQSKDYIEGFVSQYEYVQVSYMDVQKDLITLVPVILCFDEQISQEEDGYDSIEVTLNELRMLTDVDNLLVDGGFIKEGKEL